jgi:hypothetical protein
MNKGHTGGQQREALCRSYRFGHVSVDVFPELVVIAVPYAAGHDDFCDASLFVHRYTHGTDATVIDDDDHELELRMYANVENLIAGRGNHDVPGPDPRVCFWDEPRRRPEGGELVYPPADQGSALMALHHMATWTEQYVQEIVARAGVAGITLVQGLVTH